MAEPRIALKRTFSSPIVKRSLMVGLVVGTILNAINQGPEIWRGDDVIVWKLAMTYCVPFLVSSYGSYSALRAMS